MLLKKKGEVITSPLTCKVAIDPIEESSNKPVFTDVNTGDLNMSTDDIEHRLTNDSIAIQAIHLGGIACEMDKINSIARKNNLWVIEDCAQSLGAKYKGQNTGSFGDIACFSLIKNAYGIGGGILATDDKEIYDKVCSIQENFSKSSWILTIYRTIRNLTESYRTSIPGKLFYKIIMKLRGKKINYKSLKGQLSKISFWELKVSAVQIHRFPKLHSIRNDIRQAYYKILKNNGLLINNKYNPKNSSFTKFFIYNPEFKSIQKLKLLQKKGIEAMHLEQKTGSFYQEKITNKINLTNYHKIHDSLISIPLYEQLSIKDIQRIISSIRI